MEAATWARGAGGTPASRARVGGGRSVGRARPLRYVGAFAEKLRGTPTGELCAKR